VIENKIQKSEIEYKLSFIMGKRLNLHNPDVLNLTIQDLKRNYYKRAKELHPDTASQSGISESLLTERFKRLSESYNFLLEYWQNRDFSSLLKEDQYKNQYRTKPSQKQRAKKNTQSTKGFQRQEERKTTYRYRQQQGKNETPKRFYTGPMPKTEMRFAQFLYYSKKIDWNTFVQALSWQWKNRPRLGEIAVEKGYLKHAEIITILRHSFPGELFGKAAIRLGFLSERELFLLLGHQKLLNKPIGLFFIEQCSFPQSEIEKQLAQMKKFNTEVKYEKQRAGKKK
jgi:curved DNA-binding protein CbpA